MGPINGPREGTNTTSFMYYPKKGKVKCAQLFAQWNNITGSYYKKLEHCVNDD